jgi:hypothetical protein
MTDEHMLNRHLRGQSFTPLPHLSESSGVSPSNAGFSAIAPQLSWSIAGDTPSLEDLAACSWEDGEKEDKKRPGSTTSQLSTSTRGMVISPHNFMMWKEEHESNHPSKKSDDGKDGENSVRLSVMSPHSEMNMVVDAMSGTTTPLPLFFEQHLCSEERENMHDKERGSAENHRRSKRDADSDHIHQYKASPAVLLVETRRKSTSYACLWRFKTSHPALRIVQRWLCAKPSTRRKASSRFLQKRGDVWPFASRFTASQ